MASLRLVIAGFLAVLALVGAPTASAIVDGEVEPGHGYVVFVGQQVQLGGGPWVNAVACSGTLVAPTVVVTAAHCSLLPPLPPGFPPITGTRYVVMQGDTTSAPTAVSAGTFVRHPDFCVGGCAGGPEGFTNNDLAVVLLAEPLEGPYANLPKEGFVGKHFDKPKQLLAVGYGITSPELRDIGTRRSVKAQAQMLSGGENFLVLPVPAKSKYGTVCRGDSGGAALLGNTLVAVHSVGDTSCGGPSYAFRVDTPSARSFLANYVDLR